MASPSELPSFLRDDFPLDWHMTRPERATMIQLLDLARPPVAIEIGTLHGGSLQAIAPRSGRVYSIDINPEVAAKLEGRFPSVQFLTGDSTQLLPRLLEQLSARGDELGFVLIDGDHSPEGVKRDIDLVLRHVPRRPVFVVMHDSFNPGCRNGILAGAWEACPYVHYVEADFVGGVFVQQLGYPPGMKGMWGGLGLGVLLPHRRTGALTVHQSFQGTFDAVYPQSLHAAPPPAPPEPSPPPPPPWLPIRALRKAVRILLGRSRKRVA